MKPIYYPDAQQELVSTMTLINRPFISGCSWRENALRRFRAFVRGEELGDTNLVEFNDSDNVLSNVVNAITTHLTTDSLNVRLQALITIYNEIKTLTNSEYQIIHFNQAELSLVEIFLLSKLIHDLDVLKYSKREVLTEQDIRDEFDLYENTLNTLLSIYVNDEKRKEKMEMLFDLMGNNKDKAHTYLYKAFQKMGYFSVTYNIIKAGELNEINQSVTNLIVQKLNRVCPLTFENSELAILSNWTDYTLNNHGGYEEIQDNLSFILNLVKYKQELK